MDETYSLPLMLAGIAFMLFGMLWLIGRGFHLKTFWGIACAAVVGLPVFVMRHFQRSKAPLALFVIGFTLFAGPLAYNRFAPPDLGPRDKQVNGERHLTLTGWNPDKAGYRRWVRWLNNNTTGWDRLDYSMLRSMPDVAVLQMANRDVDDATLEYLDSMAALYELDINDSQITDAGLQRLAALPKLRTLRLRNTRISDAGFRAHLLPLERLIELDLTGTAVKSATVREWKAAKEGRKALK